MRRDEVSGERSLRLRGRWSRSRTGRGAAGARLDGEEIRNADRPAILENFEVVSSQTSYRTPGLVRYKNVDVNDRDLDRLEIGLIGVRAAGDLLRGASLRKEEQHETHQHRASGSRATVNQRQSSQCQEILLMSEPFYLRRTHRILAVAPTRR